MSQYLKILENIWNIFEYIWNICLIMSQYLKIWKILEKIKKINLRIGNFNTMHLFSQKENRGV